MRSALESNSQWIAYIVGTRRWRTKIAGGRCTPSCLRFLAAIVDMAAERVEGEFCEEVDVSGEVWT